MAMKISENKNISSKDSSLGPGLLKRTWNEMKWASKQLNENQLKSIQLHVDVHKDAGKEKSMREDGNARPIAPATANLYFRPLAGGLVINLKITLFKEISRNFKKFIEI